MNHHRAYRWSPSTAAETLDQFFSLYRQKKMLPLSPHHHRPWKNLSLRERAYVILEEMMERAIETAMRGIKRGDGGPFGAVIVHRGKIIASGHNSVFSSMNPTHHAEIVAIGKATRKLHRLSLEDCLLVSTTEPCPMCFSAAHWARIPVIVYGTTVQDAARAGFHEMLLSNKQLIESANLPLLVIGPFLRKRAHCLFTMYAQMRGKLY